MDSIKNKYKETLSRISACPVHFLWDGRGSARMLVRIGFMAIILGLMLKIGEKIWPTLSIEAITEPVLTFGVLLWIYGQLKSFAALYLAKKD